jgi:YidC/Oxa1 family membrane protein insertase
MLKFMPLMFVVFCYNFSSALALYWTVQNLVGIVQMYHNLNAATPQLVKVNKPKGRWAKLMEQAQQQSEAERNKRAKK